MHLPRSLSETIKSRVAHSDKIVVIYGARQVGKTTLVRHLLEETSYRALVVNGDELRYVDVLSSRDLNVLKGLVSGYELLVIDEAQRTSASI